MEKNKRIKKFGEVFTPKELVDQLLDRLSPDLFKNPDCTYLDPSCGEGAFLIEVLNRKMQNGIDHGQALKTIFGVDIQQDNVDLCRARLLRGQEHLRHIVESNIVCADALQYHYRFDGSDQYKTKQDLHIETLFSH